MALRVGTVVIQDGHMSESGHVQQNLSTILDRAASRFGDRDAVVFEDRTLGYVTLRERSRRLANGLAGLGVEPGDRVAVLLHNGLEWVEVLFALAARGAVCVPVNVLLRASEVAYVCNDADVKAMIVDEAGAEILADTDEAPPIVIAAGTAGTNLDAPPTPYEDLLQASPAVPDGPPATLHDPFVLYYSSGTTGKPKAAVHTHDNVLWNSFHQIPDLSLTQEDTYLVVPSLSWAAGFHDVMIPALWIGGRSVIMQTGNLTLDRIVSMAVAQDVSSALLVPTLLKQLIDDPGAQQAFRQAGLRFVLTGAEPVPLPVIEAFTELFPHTRLLQGYGLSEFPTIATLLREEEAVERAGWAGRPTSITHLAILTDDGEIVEQGDGEILLRTPATMRGYWNRPEQTAETLRDGWLHTGDVGTVDDDGFLKITGRKKDMIISGGLNVYPSEVETVVYGYEQVGEAAVIGVPDDKWGEVPVAVVVPDGTFDTEGFLAFCKDHLATYKTPRRVYVRDEPLPRTPSGKVLKRELRPWVLDLTDQGKADEQ